MEQVICDIDDGDKGGVFFDMEVRFTLPGFSLLAELLLLMFPFCSQVLMSVFCSCFFVSDTLSSVMLSVSSSSTVCFFFSAFLFALLPLEEFVLLLLLPLELFVPLVVGGL